MIPAPHRLVRIRPAVRTNGYGDEVLSFDAAQRDPLRGFVQPSGTAEEIGGLRAVVEVGFRVLFRGRADVDPRDRLEWDGRVFEVDGEAHPHADGRGRVVYTSVRLRDLWG